MIEKIETITGEKTVLNPTQSDTSEMFGLSFEKTKIDRLMLEGSLEYNLEDKGITVYTNKGKVLVQFDVNRFRPAEVPYLLSNTGKIRKIGFQTEHTLKDIINDQFNYFMDYKRL
jgi:GDPmannose 4,6-dehydratase